jgi:hypothetical protein
MIIEVETSTFRVEKSRADAILTLSHGQSVRGYFCVARASARSAGPDARPAFNQPPSDR